MREVAWVWRVAASGSTMVGAACAPLLLPTPTLLWLLGIGAVCGLTLTSSQLQRGSPPGGLWLPDLLTGAALGGVGSWAAIAWLVACRGAGTAIVVALVLPTAYPRLLVLGVEQARRSPPLRPILASARLSAQPSLAGLTERQLWAAWQRSCAKLLDDADLNERCRQVQHRELYLDELERRCPTGFAQWLGQATAGTLRPGTLPWPEP